MSVAQTQRKLAVWTGTTLDSEPPYRNSDLLRYLYRDRGLSTREIAERFDCSNGTVSRWLRRHDIETRDNWRAGVEVAKQLTREEYVKQRSLPTGYEYWPSTETQSDGSRVNRIVYVHRLFAVSEFGIEAVKGKHVHHRNGIPWDTRRKNIELLTPEEHGQLHGEEYWSSNSEGNQC